MSSEIPTQPDQPGIPGKYVVLAILAFGIFTTSFMWLYTYFNNRPFMPLRHALVQRFKRETSPRVEGGKERGRGANKFRIVLTVDFDPSLDTPENRQLRSTMEQDAIALAKQHLDLSPYEKWEFILIRYTPEGLPKRWESKREMSDVLQGVKASP
jgi:hypothetical protein